MFGLTPDIFIVIGSALAAAASFVVFALTFLNREEKKERYKSVIEKKRKALFEQTRNQANKKGGTQELSAKESVATFFKVQEMLGEMGERVRDKLLQAGQKQMGFV